MDQKGLLIREKTDQELRDWREKEKLALVAHVCMVVVNGNRMPRMILLPVVIVKQFR